VKSFQWTVEIEVDETWVADGFDLTDERAHDIMCHALPFAYGYEIKARVLSAPDPDTIARAQGYESDAQREALRAKRDTTT
jgi:hypothetical protein